MVYYLYFYFRLLLFQQIFSIYSENSTKVVRCPAVKVTLEHFWHVFPANTRFLMTAIDCFKLFAGSNLKYLMNLITQWADLKLATELALHRSVIKFRLHLKKNLYLQKFLYKMTSANTVHHSTTTHWFIFKMLLRVLLLIIATSIAVSIKKN